MAHRWPVGINALSAYILFSPSTHTAFAADQEVIITEVSASTYDCSSATSSDTCTVRCQVADPGGVTVNCGNAGHCEIHCDEKKCLGSATVTATDSGSLTILSSAQECVKQASVYLPDSGTAVLQNYPGSKSYKQAKIYAGSNTQSILIDCNDGGTASNDDCKQLEVYAETAQYLEIAAGADTDITDAIINCPQSSSYSGPELASCIIDITGGGLIDTVTVNTLNGSPFDFWVKNDDELGNILSLTLTCSALDNNGDTISNELHLSPSSVSRCMQPTLAPTAAPSVPTASPTTAAPTASTASPTAAPSTNPSASPSKSPSKSPSANPSASPSSTPSASPSASPISSPSSSPSQSPSTNPSYSPSAIPSNAPSVTPSKSPSAHPTRSPSANPTQSPSYTPSAPSSGPTSSPSLIPNQFPSVSTTESDSMEVAQPSTAAFTERSIAVLLICISLLMATCLVMVGAYYLYQRYTKKPSDDVQKDVDRAEFIHHVDVDPAASPSAGTKPMSSMAVKGSVKASVLEGAEGALGAVELEVCDQSGGHTLYSSGEAFSLASTPQPNIVVTAIEDEEDEMNFNAASSMTASSQSTEEKEHEIEVERQSTIMTTAMSDPEISGDDEHVHQTKGGDANANAVQRRSRESEPEQDSDDDVLLGMNGTTHTLR